MIDAATEAGLTGYVKATPALMEKLRPDVILFGEDSADAEKKTAAMFRTPEYQKVGAVKMGRVYAIPGKPITTTSHHIVKAVADVQALVK